MPLDRPWAPETSRDQRCAFCGDGEPRFVHRLDPAHVAFKAYDRGWTLPTFWAACARCDELVAGHDDDLLLSLMEHSEEDDQLRQASLAAFRAADLGSEPLPAG